MRGLVTRGSLASLAGCADSGGGAGDEALAPIVAAYGLLQVAGPELELPDGFTYRVIGVEGRTMSDGHATPGKHDGMAAFELPNGNIRLIRNHEISGDPGQLAGDPSTAYDQAAGGGTTSLEVEPVGDRMLLRDFISLNGTIVNCAGGPTPWGTWLSCEETTQGLTAGWKRPHGYVFEVSANAEAPRQTAPLKAMGRFVHEAVAIDPATGIVYQTEDRGQAGFYRFIPNQPGNLAAGGRLEMLAISEQPNYDTSAGQTVGVPLPVRWMEIADPDPATAESNTNAVFDQGFTQGGARFSRLEGCWYGEDSIFVSATNGGDAGLGQVWQYTPDAFGGELLLLFESRSAAVLDGPDTITVSPTGGLLLCEDGADDQFIRGLTSDGRIFDFVRNRLNNDEFAGATFSPDGQTLFVNIQGNPAMTLAIWGPWERGPL